MASNNVTTLFLFRQFAGLEQETKRDATLKQLITDTCNQIATVCNRIFGLDTYHTWLDWQGGNTIRVDNWPITRLYRVAFGSSDTLRVTYDGSGLHADLSYDGSSIFLHAIDSAGVDTDIEITASSQPTLSLRLPEGRVV